MASKLFLKELVPPVDLLLPKDVPELLQIIAQFMEIGDTTSAAGFTNSSVSKEPPEDTTVLWTALDANGFPLGTFKFNDGEWLSISFTKGVTQQFYVGPAVIAHPHWRICDPDVVGQPIVNGVTIPNQRDRMLVMAAPGGKYDINDIGGNDDIDFTHVHIISSFSTDGHVLTEAQSAAHVHGLGSGKIGPWTGSLGQEAGSKDNPSFSFRGDREELKATESSGGGQAHAHGIAQHTSESALSVTDVRSLFYAVGFAIYVGIGDDTAC